MVFLFAGLTFVAFIVDYLYCLRHTAGKHLPGQMAGPPLKNALRRALVAVWPELALLLAVGCLAKAPIALLPTRAVLELSMSPQDFALLATLPGAGASVA